MRLQRQRVGRVARWARRLDVDDFLARRNGVRGIWEADFLEVGPFVICLAAGEDGVDERSGKSGGCEGGG